MFKLSVLLLLISTSYGLPTVFPSHYHQQQEHHEVDHHADPYKHHDVESSPRHHVDTYNHHQDIESSHHYNGDVSSPQPYHHQSFVHDTEHHVDPYKHQDVTSFKHHVDASTPQPYHHQSFVHDTEHHVDPYKHQDVASLKHQVDASTPLPYHHQSVVHDTEHHVDPYKHHVDASTLAQPLHHPVPQSFVSHTEHHVDPYKHQDLSARHHVDVHSVQQPAAHQTFVHHGAQAHNYQSSPVYHEQTYARHGSVEHHVENKPYVQHPVAHEHEYQAKHVDHVGVVPKHNVGSDSSVASARIVQQESEVNPDGSYYNVWKSDNGINVQEQGVLKHVGDADVAIVNGDISYVDDEGHQYHLTYVADENGFHVQGDHIPTPPPVPIGIARGLEFIAAHPQVETTTYSSQHQYHPDNPAMVDN